MPENEAKQKQPFLYCQYLNQISEPGDILQNVLCHFNDEIIEMLHRQNSEKLLASAFFEPFLLFDRPPMEAI